MEIKVTWITEKLEVKVPVGNVPDGATFGITLGAQVVINSSDELKTAAQVLHGTAVEILQSRVASRGLTWPLQK